MRRGRAQRTTRGTPGASSLELQQKPCYKCGMQLDINDQHTTSCKANAREYYCAGTEHYLCRDRVAENHQKRQKKDVEADQTEQDDLDRRDEKLAAATLVVVGGLPPASGADENEMKQELADEDG